MCRRYMSLVRAACNFLLSVAVLDLQRGMKVSQMKCRYRRTRPCFGGAGWPRNNAATSRPRGARSKSRRFGHPNARENPRNSHSGMRRARFDGKCGFWAEVDDLGGGRRWRVCDGEGGEMGGWCGGLWVGLSSVGSRWGVGALSCWSVLWPLGRAIFGLGGMWASGLDYAGLG
ncbi:hypothetical protein K402DRAFT_97376 [Aulographum hederae CBS 113979]|uniref:Uncharacterized protein n=1 Tax=Aulographum hederae CBS 113979 TaxID=1176131 RepID=A0A6G1GYK7_9PEZI|nr:hypothetical protein K402DRAFT_97376 [Aulographum hederae CBS 113979]